MPSIGAISNTMYPSRYPEECKGLILPPSLCQSYLSSVNDHDRLTTELFRSCSCEREPIHCRGLDVYIYPSTYTYIFTCKKTASESCKEAGLAFYDLWVKVPDEADMCCFLKYALQMKLVSSCNRTLE